MNKISLGMALLSATIALSQLASAKTLATFGKPYRVAGEWYTPKQELDYDMTGIASWYGSACTRILRSSLPPTCARPHRQGSK
jgi:rare lipoprotein A (peptidoglycan hydrolase)